MRKSNHPAIRALLGRHPHGLTTTQVADKLQVERAVIAQSLKACQGVYVSHWIDQGTCYGGWAQVWRAAPVPKNAPKPTTPSAAC